MEKKNNTDKEEGPFLNENGEIDFDDKKSISKYIKKVKFFWRGINFNYPYTFVKLIPSNEEDNVE